MLKPKRDLTGMSFGRLSVIAPIGVDKFRRTIWKLRCSCGKFVTVQVGDLTSGRTNSCGCLKIEMLIKRTRTHGESDSTPEYIAWKAMHRRCKKNNKYKKRRYWDRGIRVCKRWEEFKNFLIDMGRRPSDKHSIDRINNNKGYSLKNCRWATVEEQSFNKQNSVITRYRGNIISLMELSKIVKVKYATLLYRYHRGYRGIRLYKPSRKLTHGKEAISTIKV